MDVHAAGQLAHLGFRGLVHLLDSGVDGSRHQVFQHLNVVRIHGLGLDLDGQHLVLAIHLDGDHLTGGAAGVLGGFQLGLLGLHVILHLLSLTHQGVHIGAAKACGHSCFHNWFSLKVIIYFFFSSRCPQCSRPDPAFPAHGATVRHWRCALRRCGARRGR